MRITVSQLRRIIKEEVQRTLAEAAPANRSDPKWVALKKFLGSKEYRRMFTGPEEVSVNSEKGWGDRKLSKDLRVIFYDQLQPAYYELVDAYSAGEDSAKFKSALKKVNAAVDKFEVAHKAWEPTADAHHRASMAGQEATDAHPVRRARRASPEADATYVARKPDSGHKMTPEEEEHDNWLWSGAPSRARDFLPTPPGPGASKEDWDNYYYSGGR